MKKSDKQGITTPRPMTKRQLTRHQREQRLRQLIFGLTGAVIVLILGILAYGFWREYVAIADEPVARVGDTAVPTRDMAKLIGYYDSFYGRQIAELRSFIADNQADESKKDLVEAATLQIQQMQSLASQSDGMALDQLVEGEVLRREAAARNLQLEQSDRDRALVKNFDLQLEELAARLAATDDPQPAAPEETAAPSAEEVAAAQEKLKAVLEDGRILSEGEFNHWVLEPLAIQIKIQSELAANVPTSAEQVKARHILFETEEQAKDALAKIKEGSLDFAAAAQEMSLDPGSKDKGGDLGWFPRGIMDTAFEEAAFSLEPGAMSEVVSSSFGFHIIQVEEKAESRPLEPDILEYLRGAEYSKWLSDQRNSEANKVVYEYDVAKAEWARNNAPKPNLPQASG